MRVAFIIPAITAGGAERVVVRLANFLVENGCEVFIIVQRMSDIDYNLSPSVKLEVMPLLDAKSILEFVEKENIDVISDHYHWSLQHLREIAKVAKQGVKIILSEHNSYFYPLFQYAYEANRPGLELFGERPELYRNFSAVTSLTRYSANLLTSEKAGKIVLMYNPLSYESATLSELREPRILSVSSFIKPAKRIDKLISVFSEINTKMSGAKLRIVGEMDFARFLMYCRRANIVDASVEPIGLSDKVTEHYLASSVFALSSDIEGQPKVPLEAALHGIPQIVYDIPGIEDQILHGDTGYIIEQDDAVGFAEHAVGLLRDFDARQRMGLRAREFVTERFGPQKIGERWLRLLDGVARTGAPPADLIWSASAEEAQGLRADVAPEFNRWFQKALNPRAAVLVSVIVPVYGTEALLGRCLDSLVNQSLRDIEIVVVNDKSPGNTAEIVEAYAAKDSRIVYVEHETNRGLYQARSTGAKAAQGAYLAHVDSDDFVHPDFLRQLYETAVTTGAEIVECAAVEILLDGSRRPIGAQGLRELNQPELLDAFIDERMRHVVWNKLYKRSLWDRTPLHMDVQRQFNVTEDLLRNAPLFAHAKRYTFIDRVLYYYVRRPESCVTDGDFARMLRKLKDIMYVYDSVITFLREKGLPDERLAKMREREIKDCGWYMANGYSPEAERSSDPLALAWQEFGPFGALAASQSHELQKLRQTEKKYWDMVKAQGDASERVPRSEYTRVLTRIEKLELERSVC